MHAKIANDVRSCAVHLSTRAFAAILDARCRIDASERRHESALAPRSDSLLKLAAENRSDLHSREWFRGLAATIHRGGSRGIGNPLEALSSR
jgi:hypothetical protein